jgi:hypothetical protein
MNLQLSHRKGFIMQIQATQKYAQLICGVRQEDTMFKLMDGLLNTVIAVIGFLMVAALFNKYTGAPPWVAGFLLCVVGVGLYLGNVLLIRSYLMKRTPELANDEMWEKTVGAGIVPRWVSFLGLLAIPAFIAAGIWFFAWF